MSDALAELDQEQRAAATATERCVRVRAGAGSGKTRALVARVRWLIGQGAPPERVLVSTFSKKAADELLHRLGVEARGARVGTLHSLGYAILRRERPGRVVADASVSRRCIRLAMKEVDCRDNFSEVRLAITRAKGTDEPIWPHLAGVLQAYDALLAREKRWDFDDLLLQPVRLFEGNPAVLRRWNGLWWHVLIDETQDTSALQYRLLRALVGPETHVFAVGDIAQAIYSWRGARPNELLQLEQQFGAPFTDYPIATNYRSLPPVVETGNKVVVGKQEGAIEMRPYRVPSDGADVLYLLPPAADSYEEASAIADHLTVFHEGEPLRRLLCCLRCTNALLAERAAGRVDDGEGPRVVPLGDDERSGGPDSGMQPVDDRPSVAGDRSVARGEAGSSAESTVEGRSLSDLEWLRDDPGRAATLSARAPSGDGADARSTVASGRGGSPSQRGEVGERRGQSRASVVERGAHARASSSLSATDQRRVVADGARDVAAADCAVSRARADDSAGVAARRCARCGADAVNELTWFRPFQWSDIAILTRTNAQTEAFESVLLQRQIPAVVWGGTGFYGRQEVLDCLAYLSLARGVVDEEALERVYNRPSRYLGEVWRRELAAQGGWPALLAGGAGGFSRPYMNRNAEQLVHQLGVLRRLHEQDPAPAPVLEYLYDVLGYRRWLVGEEPSVEDECRGENLDALMAAAKRQPSVESLLAFAERTRRASSRKTGDAVVLATVHKAKGLEWPLVVVAGVTEGKLPHVMASTPEQRQEERRVLYVALTRARDRLLVSCYGRPSPFYLELGGKAGAVADAERDQLVFDLDRKLSARERECVEDAVIEERDLLAGPPGDWSAEPKDGGADGTDDAAAAGGSDRVGASGAGGAGDDAPRDAPRGRRRGPRAGARAGGAADAVGSPGGADGGDGDGVPRGVVGAGGGAEAGPGGGGA